MIKNSRRGSLHNVGKNITSTFANATPEENRGQRQDRRNWFGRPTQSSDNFPALVVRRDCKHVRVVGFEIRNRHSPEIGGDSNTATPQLRIVQGHVRPGSFALSVNDPKGLLSLDINASGQEILNANRDGGGRTSNKERRPGCS